MTDKLLPCPFCGGKADYCETNAWWVQCNECNAETDADMSPEAAAEIWNRRTPPPSSHMRAPYDLRLKIGKALDQIVCDDSTPEQVDKFIETFREFGLTISAACPTPLLDQWREGAFETTADEAALSALDQQAEGLDAAAIIEACLTALTTTEGKDNG